MTEANATTPFHGPTSSRRSPSTGSGRGAGPRPAQGRVVLVDDHVMLREGLRLLLNRIGLQVVGAAGDAAAAYELVRTTHPDVVVVDLVLGDGPTGAALARRLSREDPELGIVVYTGLEGRRELSEALDCGARGFALKAGSPGELLRAVRVVASGGTYVDPRLPPLVLGRSKTERIPALSSREREILDLLARGLTGEEIARQLFLSPETVRTHVRNAMAKLDARTRVHAITIALRQGEITL